MKVEIKILPHAKEFYWDGKEHLCNGPISYNLPKYATEGSAAVDLVCIEDVTVFPDETKMIPTGLAVWIGSEREHLGFGVFSEGLQHSVYEKVSVFGLILPRSGLGTKGLILANTVGVLDEDFQGEIMVSAWNRLPPDPSPRFVDPFVGTQFTRGDYNKIELKAGDRFAQLGLMPVIKAEWSLVEEFSDTTERGQGGFGSSGV